MDKLIELAKIAFASEFSFYLKSHQFHWNCEGIYFKQFHDLFGEIYTDVYESIDDFAEKIRSLGTYMPGSYTRFSMLSKIEDETQILDSKSMAEELLKDSEKMKVIFKKLFEVSEAANEYGFSDFVAGRLDAHSKYSWMLRATLK